LFQHHPNICKGLARLCEAEKAYLAGAIRAVLHANQRRTVQADLNIVALHRHFHVGLDAHFIAPPGAPDFSVIRPISLVQPGYRTPAHSILDQQQPVEMFRVEKPEYYSEAVVVSRPGPHCEVIVLPSCISGDKARTIPTADEVASPAPYVAGLVQPPVAFDPPDRRALDRVRIINYGPVVQAGVVESFVEYDAAAP